jgi:hypothetical protein
MLALVNIEICNSIIGPGNIFSASSGASDVRV